MKSNVSGLLVQGSGSQWGYVRFVLDIFKMNIYFKKAFENSSLIK